MTCKAQQYGDSMGKMLAVFSKSFLSGKDPDTSGFSLNAIVTKQASSRCIAVLQSASLVYSKSRAGKLSFLA